jgi:hypothetical protein
VAVSLTALSLLHHCVAVAVRALRVKKKVDYHYQCWGSGSAGFWASRIRIRILLFSEIMLAKAGF